MAKAVFASVRCRLTALYGHGPVCEVALMGAIYESKKPTKPRFLCV